MIGDRPAPAAFPMIGLVVRWLGLLPLPALYAIGRVIAFVAGPLLRWHVPLARRNLAASLPELAEAEREAILARNYRAMGETLAESIWGWRRGGRALADRVTIDNRDLVDRYVGQRQSVVLLTAHVCNWEWLLLAAGAQLRIPIDPIYKRVRVPSMDRYLQEARSRDGGRPIELADLLTELMLRVGTPRAYGLLADQTPGRREPKHWLPFLHQDTPFYYGFGKIAQFLDAPVVYVAMRRLSRGRYAAHLHVLAEPPYDEDPEALIVRRYAERLEAEVRASPADWLWAYRRWKSPKPAEPEPASGAAARRAKRAAARRAAP
jgi:Kdo2-lipid IVA lauroyltransferase/acyltransferase